ncbi:Peptidase A1 [Corchorus olitorius]|uniref:Peptidase A1 n=1 Tax=Corchorus olitorius TaxID=93759 RepID=A0A1R3GV14_9ROSI|nr:Peptidase A1 [Corchorus olitorius]
MDVRRLALVVLAVAVAVVGEFGGSSYANVMTFDVKRKFSGKANNLSALKAHDYRRHDRLLSAVNVDLPIGGNGHPTETGLVFLPLFIYLFWLYFAKIGLGNPSKDYYVQVDTGSDILWVNCAGCDKCPTKSDLGIDLTLYDPKGSSTSSLVYCDQDFCTSTYDGQLPGCKPNIQCQYNVVYGDGSSTAGYFVNDTVHLQQVTGNLQTGSTNGTVIFGVHQFCEFWFTGSLFEGIQKRDPAHLELIFLLPLLSYLGLYGCTSSEALDGILGFGQANSSMLSQLAAAGKVKKIFAHCLDNTDGGGIFAIGEVVSPKVNTTPMVPNQAHYNVVMKAVEVGDSVIDLPSDIFDSGDRKRTIIDSGATLAYLPLTIYQPLMNKVNSLPHLTLI